MCDDAKKSNCAMACMSFDVKSDVFVASAALCSATIGGNYYCSYEESMEVGGHSCDVGPKCEDGTIKSCDRSDLLVLGITDDLSPDVSCMWPMKYIEVASSVAIMCLRDCSKGSGLMTKVCKCKETDETI